MIKLVVYVHGKGGNAQEAEHYKAMFPNCGVIGFDYKSETPWEAKEEFKKYFDEKKREYDSVILIANSIGAFFSMNTLSEKQIDKAFFISPVVDMENLIENMMHWAGVTEEELKARKEIKTDFGETLSYNYLEYVRENPISWRVSTDILYGEKDNLTSKEVITVFAEKTGSSLTIMNRRVTFVTRRIALSFIFSWFYFLLFEVSRT